MIDAKKFLISFVVYIIVSNLLGYVIYAAGLGQYASAPYGQGFNPVVLAVLTAASMVVVAIAFYISLRVYNGIRAPFRPVVPKFVGAFLILFVGTYLLSTAYLYLTGAPNSLIPLYYHSWYLQSELLSPIVYALVMLYLSFLVYGVGKNQPQ